jgi:hypothetical protein
MVRERPGMAPSPASPRLHQEQWGQCSIEPSQETIAGFEHLAAAQGPYLSRAFNALKCLRHSRPRNRLSARRIPMQAISLRISCLRDDIALEGSEWC